MSGKPATTEAEDEHEEAATDQEKQSQGYSCCEHEDGLEGHGPFCCIHGEN
jgi:hypothetical protein